MSEQDAWQLELPLPPHLEYYNPDTPTLIRAQAPQSESQISERSDYYYYCTDFFPLHPTHIIYLPIPKPVPDPETLIHSYPPQTTSQHTITTPNPTKFKIHNSTNIHKQACPFLALPSELRALVYFNLTPNKVASINLSNSLLLPLLNTCHLLRSEVIAYLYIFPNFTFNKPRICILFLRLTQNLIWKIETLILGLRCRETIHLFPILRLLAQVGSNAGRLKRLEIWFGKEKTSSYSVGWIKSLTCSGIGFVCPEKGNDNETPVLEFKGNAGKARERNMYLREMRLERVNRWLKAEGYSVTTLIESDKRWARKCLLGRESWGGVAGLGKLGRGLGRSLRYLRVYGRACDVGEMKEGFETWVEGVVEGMLGEAEMVGRRVLVVDREDWWLRMKEVGRVVERIENGEEEEENEEKERGLEWLEIWIEGEERRI